MADSFQLAGDRLVDTARENYEERELFQPAIFNYRHATELYIKAVIGEEINHNLNELLQKLKAILKVEFGAVPPEWFVNIKALPTKRALINNFNGNIVVKYSHEKFVWIKNGLIFKIIGGGFVSLNIANNLISKDPPFVKNNLKLLVPATFIFLIGELLNLNFEPYLQMGKKFHLVIR